MIGTGHPRPVVEFMNAGALVSILLEDGSSESLAEHAERLKSCYRTLAFRLLEIPSSCREEVVQATLTSELIARILQQIGKRGIGWTTLLFVLGNATSPGWPWLANFLLDSDCMQIILPLISVQEVVSDLGRSVEDAILWIVANLSKCAVYDSRVAFALQSFIPVLRDRLKLVPNKATQRYMRAFRAFAALAPATDVANHMTPAAIQWLLDEYAAALQGRALPKSNFYPNVDDRALTVLCLSRDRHGRSRLVAAGAIRLLAQSLHCKKKDDERGTARLWAWTVEAIHKIATSKELHGELVKSNRDVLPGLQSLASGRKTSGIQVTKMTRCLAADSAVALGARWEVERLLWLAVLKNDLTQACWMSELPSGLIRLVMKWLIILEEYPMRKLEIIPNILLCK